MSLLDLRLQRLDHAAALRPGNSSAVSVFINNSCYYFLYMEQFDHLIDELAGMAGIIPEYYDIFGTKHIASIESKKAILSAMGLRVGTAEDVLREIEKMRTGPWLSLLDPVTVISVQSQPYYLPMYLAAPEGKEQGTEIRLSLEDEQGKREELDFYGVSLQKTEERHIGGRRIIRMLLPLPQKNTGYYRVQLACSHPEPVFAGGRSSLEGSSRFIVAPDACFMPEQLQTGKTWGIAVNLYALRSMRNWGAGDFGDLEKLIAWASGLDAGFVGINPLHAIPNTVPFGISPYSPISRLYRNFIYIDMERVDELARIPLSNDVAGKITSVRKSEQVDYEGVAEVKRELLEQAFEIFYRDHYQTGSARGRLFRDYLRDEGSALEEFALFCALSEFMKNGRKAFRWTEWPEEYRRPGSAAVAAFRNNHEKEVLFYAYVQWLIDCQMDSLSAAASSAGMPVGVYGDLAVGAVENGSDGWTYQDVLAEQVTVGAPPDDFNHIGQDWGFPPMIPDKLRESGYELFIRTIRKNMEHLGALRIDHALGLFRLFWIPKGMQPADGAYVRCNAEDLLRIIALESVRNRTMVIGEDLGTITDEARQALQRFGILSYRLFYFERNYPDPSFLAPERYPSMALSAVTTHDLPTLAGYWSGKDLDVKKELRIIRDEQAYEKQKSDRERDRNLVVKALETRGMLPVDPGEDGHRSAAMTTALCSAVYQYLAISPAKLVLVSLDDVIGTMDQQNLPGTVAEYPNWRQKVPLSLEKITADPRFTDLARMFRNTRPIKKNEVEAKASS